MDRVRIEAKPALRRPTLVAAFSGWNDAGSSATTAVQYTAERLGATPFASIEGEEFFDFTVQRPMVKLDGNQLRTIEWTDFAFLAEETSDLIFLTAPEPHLRWKTFCESVLHVARETGVQRVALLGSFLAQVVYSDPVPVTGFASDPQALTSLAIAPTTYQGPTGIVGVLADAFRRESIPVVSIWAAVPHYIAATPNPRAALALLLKLRGWLDIALELGPLEAAATMFQSKLLEAIESDRDLSNYVRGLKKDEPSH
ncbi:MAG: hypothetical protein QOD06_781 [Candidatus Binatota bacterium]|jgi:predicted ATP-grasp superfamily ATP-dependent carboligase|nr:hypothetical protein [Candidatus Binatota bacterium]